MNFIRKNYRIIVFSLILFIQMFFINVNLYQWDATWEYGFCHAFVMGEIPYVDFNIISTPLFIFLFSLGLFLKDTFIVFLIESFILNIVVFYFVDKVLKEKSIIYIFAICGLFFFALIPTYNYLAFSLVVLLLCFEKLDYSDGLIGLFWGLLILAKHTIGVPIVLIVLFGLFIKKYKFSNICKRIAFMLMPLLLFLGYLLVTNSFYLFFDLCIMGLFGFASKNSNISLYFFLSIAIFIISIILVIKKKDNILLYYLLGAITFCIPIFDKSHISFYFIIFFVIWLYNSKLELTSYKIVYIWMIIAVLTNCVINYRDYKGLKLSKLSHYEYLLINNEFETSINYIHKKLSIYDNYYLINEINMFYDIVYDRKITYYDVPLYGNFGYSGSSKFIDYINNETDCYFVVETDPKRLSTQQLDLKAIDYIKDNFKKVESVGIFTIYYKE